MQPMNMIRIYYWEKKLRKRLHVLEADILKQLKKKDWFDVSCWKDEYLQDVFEMAAIECISVINHFHINGLHLFWDSLYLEKEGNCS